MAEDFRRTQALVVASAALAVGVSVCAVFGPTYLPSLQFEAASLEGRLRIWASADVLVIFWLFVGIARIANHRFFSPADIDGGGLTEGTAKVTVLRAVLQNTIEQCVLALFVHLAWIILMPAPLASVVVFCATLFFVGRLLFALGYAYGAGARAFGFGLTFYPSVILLIVLFVNAPYRQILAPFFRR